MTKLHAVNEEMKSKTQGNAMKHNFRAAITL